MNKKEVAIKVGLGVAKGLALGCVCTAAIAVGFLEGVMKPNNCKSKVRVMSGFGSPKSRR